LRPGAFGRCVALAPIRAWIAGLVWPNGYAPHNRGNGSGLSHRAAIALSAAKRKERDSHEDRVRREFTRLGGDAYWGPVADLRNNKQIPMNPSERHRHRTLSENVFDARIDVRWRPAKFLRLSLA